jgi:tRNA G10  N-methylase Trm11
MLGDCLEIMPTLGKVDAVVTDPPYGMLQCRGRGGAESTTTTWDDLINPVGRAVYQSRTRGVLVRPLAKAGGGRGGNEFPAAVGNHMGKRYSRWPALPGGNAGRAHMGFLREWHQARDV